MNKTFAATLGAAALSLSITAQAAQFAEAPETPMLYTSIERSVLQAMPERASAPVAATQQARTGGLYATFSQVLWGGDRAAPLYATFAKVLWHEDAPVAREHYSELTR